MYTMETSLKEEKKTRYIHRFTLIDQRWILPENVKSVISANLGLYSLLNVVVVDFEWNPELLVDDSLERLSINFFVLALNNDVNNWSKSTFEYTRD